jgi:hypothetical protein
MQPALKRRRTILGQAKAKKTPVRSGISVTGKKAPRPSVDLRRGVSRITRRRA